MSKKHLTETRPYYKGGDIVYELPTGASKYLKASEKRRHIRFNGWGDLERLYKDEKTR